MVRKTKTQADACPSKNSDNKEPEEDRKTFLVLSFPLIVFFNIIKALLFELFIILKFVYSTSSRLLNKPTNQQEVVNLEVVKGDENKDFDMDLTQRQKFHHKRAFEFISQALKIDETQNPGVYCNNLIIQSTHKIALLLYMEVFVDDVIHSPCCL